MYRILILLLVSYSMFSQENTSQLNTLNVKVQSENLETLIGASVKITSKKDSSVFGAYTKVDGSAKIKDIPNGEYQAIVSYIGYKPVIEDFYFSKDTTIVFTLLGGAIRSKTIEVVADRAKFRETPIAFSSILKEEIDLKLGGDDAPIILNETPGVHATRNGQGFGESRINIRGFQQRNLAVLINGVPVNDMENGRVFWSNWDGIGDVTSSQQVQRGLGASKIANPSVGGTMNIITDAAKRKAGVTFKQQYGFYDNSVDDFQLVNDNGDVIYDKPFNSHFYQSRLILNTGLIDKFALTASVSRKTGEGPTDATWIDAYSYYIGLSYDLSENHYLDFYLYGAPQVRGRKAFRQPVAAYSEKFARDLGIPEESIQAVANDLGTNYGRFNNPNWGYVNLKGSDYDPIRNYQLDDRTLNWHYDDKLNRYMNFYHKPHATLNWYWQIDKKSSLTSVFYLSTGSGGGTNIHGLPITNDLFGTNTIPFDQSFIDNFQNRDLNYSDARLRSSQVLTSSLNNHFWTGGLFTYDRNFANDIKVQTGLDIRYYEAEHYRMISHTLGAESNYYVETIRNLATGEFIDSVANDNVAVNGTTQDWMKFRGDRITYDYDGRVLMSGGFFQLEKKWSDKATYYFNSSVVNAAYEREDYFRLPESRIANASYIGYTIKTGANWNINDNFNIYSNNGFYSRPPFFTTVFTDQNVKIDEVKNEDVLGIELGSGFQNDDRNFKSNLNLYYTNWLNQNDINFVPLGGEVESDYNGAVLSVGQDALHMGIEWDFYWKPIREAWFKGSISWGDWRWTNNPLLVPIDTRIPEEQRQYELDRLYIDGLKVGDAPQKMIFLSATVLPMKLIFNRDKIKGFENLLISASFKYNWDFYTDFQPDALTNYVGLLRDPNVESVFIPQPWELPAYWTLNVFASYRFFDVIGDIDIDVVFRINNITDNIYVSDANFRNPVNAFVGDNGQVQGNFGRADEAEVHLGFPRSYNAEIKINI